MVGRFVTTTTYQNVNTVVTTEGIVLVCKNMVNG